MALEEEEMKKKAIAILLLLVIMFCAFAEEKTLNVNLSITPIFEVKWTSFQLTDDNAKTTSLDSLEKLEPIELKMEETDDGVVYRSDNTIYASWRTNYAQPLEIKISANHLSKEGVNLPIPVYFSIEEDNSGNADGLGNYSSDKSATYNQDKLTAPVNGSYLRYDSIPVTNITVLESDIILPKGTPIGTVIDFTGTMTITVTVG